MPLFYFISCQLKHKLDLRNGCQREGHKSYKKPLLYDLVSASLNPVITNKIIPCDRHTSWYCSLPQDNFDTVVYTFVSCQHCNCHGRYILDPHKSAHVVTLSDSIQEVPSSNLDCDTCYPHRHTSLFSLVACISSWWDGVCI